LESRLAVMQALVLLTGLQALGGRAPFDLSGVGAVVLIVSTTAILAASGVALVGVRPRLSPSRCLTAKQLPLASAIG